MALGDLAKHFWKESRLGGGEGIFRRDDEGEFHGVLSTLAKKRLEDSKRASGQDNLLGPQLDAAREARLRYEQSPKNIHQLLGSPSLPTADQVAEGMDKALWAGPKAGLGLLKYAMDTVRGEQKPKPQMSDFPGMSSMESWHEYGKVMPPEWQEKYLNDPEAAFKAGWRTEPEGLYDTSVSTWPRATLYRKGSKE